MMDCLAENQATYTHASNSAGPIQRGDRYLRGPFHDRRDIAIRGVCLDRHKPKFVLQSMSVRYRDRICHTAIGTSNPHLKELKRRGSDEGRQCGPDANVLDTQ